MGRAGPSLSRVCARPARRGARVATAAPPSPLSPHTGGGGGARARTRAATARDYGARRVCDALTRPGLRRRAARRRGRRRRARRRGGRRRGRRRRRGALGQPDGVEDEGDDEGGEGGVFAEKKMAGRGRAR